MESYKIKVAGTAYVSRRCNGSQDSYSLILSIKKTGSPHMSVSDLVLPISLREYNSITKKLKPLKDTSKEVKLLIKGDLEIMVESIYIN